MNISNDNNKKEMVEHQRRGFNTQLKLIAEALEAKGFMVLHDPSGHDYDNEVIVVIKISCVPDGDRERPYLATEIEKDIVHIPSGEELIGNILLNVNGKVNEENIHMNIFVTRKKDVLKYYNESGELVPLIEILIELKEVLEIIQK
jgi:hypothetical protein